MSDPYVYPGTNTLINRFEIKDETKLQRLESLLYIKQSKKPLPEGSFDYKHLKAIHEHFFGEIYPWAGKERTIDIAKGNSYFGHFSFVDKELNKLLGKLRQQDNCLKGLSEDVFIKKITYYFAELNAIHPFREGNGRTQRAFCKALAENAGFELDWSRVDRDTYINASIDSFNGNNQAMENLVSSITTKQHEQVKEKTNIALKDNAAKLKKEFPILAEYTNLLSTRKKLGGYQAEVVDKKLSLMARTILKDKHLVLKIREQQPKILNALKEQVSLGKGFER